MVPLPVAEFEHDAVAVWPSAATMTRIRGVLLAVTFFFGIAVYVFHTVAARPPHDVIFLHKLRGVGILTWLFALVQMVDMRFYHSRFARRRRAAMRIPETLHGWLLGQMLASFGIVYYGFAEDLRWYIAGVAILALSFLAFPIARR